MKDENDKKLLDSILGGDHSAQKSFYNLYSAYFTTICCRYIADRDAVKDVLQESFIKIFNSIHQFQYRGSGSLRAWSSRIVVNECLKFLKNKSIYATIPIEDIGDIEVENEDLDDIPIAVIMEMIQSLPDGYRTVFNLFVFEQKSHKEIAKMLDIAENSSASQYHRAKKVLMKQAEEYRLHNKENK